MPERLEDDLSASFAPASGTRRRAPPRKLDPDDSAPQSLRSAAAAKPKTKKAKKKKRASTSKSQRKRGASALRLPCRHPRLQADVLTRVLPRAAKPRGAATTEQQAVAGDDSEEEQIEDKGFGTSQLTDIDITDITVKLIIDGGKAKTLRSVQPPAELSQFEGPLLVAALLSGELRVNEAEPGSVFAGFPADVDALTPDQQLLLLNATVFQLQTAATTELRSLPVVAGWAAKLMSLDDIKAEYDEEAEYFETVQPELRAQLFLAEGNVLTWLHSGAALVSRVRAALEQAEEAPELTFMLRPMAVDPPAGRRRGAGSGGAAAAPIGRPISRKKVLLVLYTGTFQTEKAGNVTFFRTEDAPEPVQLIVEMEELPKPVRSQLHVESALRQTVR